MKIEMKTDRGEEEDRHARRQAGMDDGDDGAGGDVDVDDD